MSKLRIVPEQFKCNLDATGRNKDPYMNVPPPVLHHMKQVNGLSDQYGKAIKELDEDFLCGYDICDKRFTFIQGRFDTIEATLKERINNCYMESDYKVKEEAKCTLQMIRGIEDEIMKKVTNNM